MNEETQKENLLKYFLKELDKHVFVSSVNIITTKEEKLNPEIEDLEAIIEINGSWDREDLKNILYKIAN